MREEAWEGPLKRSVVENWSQFGLGKELSMAKLSIVSLFQSHRVRESPEFQNLQVRTHDKTFSTSIFQIVLWQRYYKLNEREATECSPHLKLTHIK
jgi:hypothetical protein